MTPSIFIATPMYGGHASAHYVDSILRLQRECMQQGIKLSWSFLTTESLITRGRNNLAAAFLASDCSHHVSIDADIEFQARDVLRLVHSGLDFTCGLYPMKMIDWNRVKHNMLENMPMEQIVADTSPSVCNFISSDHGNENPVRVSRCGTGFMCLTRKVFETLQNTVPTYLGNRPGEVNKIFYEFFDTAVDPHTRHLLSEDYYFCDLWRKHGGDIWAFLDINLRHIGMHEYCNTTKYLMPRPL